ncbi:cystathionine beta-lyase [Mesorhizobium sp. M1C.F.Ca.ET.193.01.1.1]|uniref:trans-sulfuration enzyme family protein n=1 Tax=unclassified Mesorhizobium TaxID=325217 RepID=UPI000FD48E12|nr:MULTISPECIES: PLP-dependent transferase [unclassified Mesorhizobium]TGT01336.1 cystathionine beta-lyase [bacterium M00.F.Ca.ET.177.01.1.1]TGQ54099.1 cystathionine beta-lyase [Mesorhizobium sp. M1C.F.Ca.ET.210.01.1.1]TGQ72113.1 cystathionine beta-lyase [Mesorhizobium sp. M1C.F.Ca.ET.212.01.1.1]TGR09928.1 cystathionine beta-lyase [Mesorhizobium sp. M1C.F.Ca.ET.204.01.1.1]TGR30048.1 cystathionine beta-lyase [Mesorhizobium sp. M1C.F.Ca.ET.196.01.1.1]
MTRRDDTLHIHPPKRSEEPFQAVAMPVERASTVVFDDLESFERRVERLYDGFTYGLYGTPTSRQLEDHIAAVEGGSRALVVPSGMAAMTLATMAVCRSDEKVLIPETLYGPARDMAERFLGPLGIEVISYDPRLDAGIAAVIDGRTRLVWVESPGSATFEVQDVSAIATVAHKAGALVAADNTWASHLLFKPLAHGVDISMQALSKHAGGHGDLLMGSVAVNDPALFRRLKDTARFLGYGVSPEDCALCERGLMTMPVRMRHADGTARKIVAWLSERPEVAQILHPGQLGHPGHAIWKRDFIGSAGVFSFVLRPELATRQSVVLRALRLFRLGASWGGVHSLIAVSDPRKGRTSLDWLQPGPVWRLSIGLEALEDLLADLSQAFELFAHAAQRGRDAIEGGAKAAE